MKQGIAVILPVYNHAHFIDAALESALAQTLKPTRIIALNDGSTDTTAARLEAWKQRGIEVHHQSNQGAAHTLNRLTQLAAETCNWISILNSDDIYEPNRLAICAARSLETGASVVTTELTVVDESNKTLAEDAARNRWFKNRTHIHKTFQPTTAGWLGFCNYAVSTSNIFARTDHLQQLPFAENLPLFHDYLFLIQSAIQGKITHLQTPTLRYRAHGKNSISVDHYRLHTEGLKLLNALDVWLPSALQTKTARQRYEEFLSTLPANISSLRWEVHASHRHLPTTTPSNAPIPPRDTLSDLLTAHQPSLIGALAAMVENHPLRQENRLRRLMQRSRWLALGTCLGWKNPRIAENIPASDSSRRLQEALRSSKWLYFGQKIGSKRCRKIRQLLTNPAQNNHISPLP